MERAKVFKVGDFPFVTKNMFFFCSFCEQIHQKIDDLGRGTGPARNESLKTGNAGPRLACGVIFYMPTN